MAAKKTCQRSSSGNSKFKWEPRIESEVADGREEEHSLLVGIPDDITVNHILTKLPWTAMFSISHVNNCWRRAVKSRKLYNARVMKGCTETLVPIMHRAPMYGTQVYSPCGKWKRITQAESLPNEALSLYDSVKGSWNLLPPVPPLLAGIPEGCGCVCLNGKVYVLGGLHVPPRAAFSDGPTFRTSSSDDYEKVSRKEVYSLDLAAGDTTWKKCADMTCARAWFHCGVQDGNIYVFWGVNRWGGTKYAPKEVLEVEVYDSEEDLWDLVAPVPFPDILRYSSFKTFAAVGETFVIHSYFEDMVSPSLSVEHTYDTARDEWKIVQRTKGDSDPTSASVTVNQKVYVIDPKSSTLKVYNENSPTSTSVYSSVTWKFLNPRVESIPFRPYLEVGSGSLFSNLLRSVRPDNFQPRLKSIREVLALAIVKSDLKGVTIVGLTRTTDIATQFRSYPEQLALFTGRWSGDDQLQFVFEEFECPHPLLDWQKYSLFPLHL